MELLKWVASVIASIVIVGGGLFIAFCAAIFTTALQIGGLLMMVIAGVAMAVKNSISSKDE